MSEKKVLTGDDLTHEVGNSVARVANSMNLITNKLDQVLDVLNRFMPENSGPAPSFSFNSSKPLRKPFDKEVVT